MKKLSNKNVEPLLERSLCLLMIFFSPYLFLFVKPTDTHQFLDPTSSDPYHCKKGIPYSQALRLNRIYSDNVNFDKRCNDLEKWLMERGYNKKLMCKQILRACTHSRNNRFEREEPQMSEQKLTSNITYYPAFQNLEL